MSAKIQTGKPPYRKLRGYAFDPITSLDLDTAEINQIVYKVPWEEDLKPGPEGDYIKIVDRDPASDAVYAPVDLNTPAILASEGLAPSETNPQFHQQMVYAVIMSTIKNFEKALGRKVTWSPVEKFVMNPRTKKRDKRVFEFVEKLLVYPHAVRDQNAYYSPDRKALIFGYYNATPVKGGTFLPGGIVYSCLSHDIIAHETTHALLDGMYSRFMETTHPDLAGFHEGFSDIVAMLQHFTYPEIVKNQIRKSRGKLDTETLLAKLAVEFGQSTGEYHSLRDAIGRSEEGIWTKRKPSTMDYETNLECHDRGALLVSAVFDAFLAIYQSRTEDLVRIATNGTGEIPAGDIHPDLVGRLADEAAKAASHVLSMCVRALDYCPPVDLNYGDYLRALITADKELVVNDEHNYRIAFINAFRKRGIFPEGVPNLSVDTLCYNVLDDETDKSGFTKMISEFLRQFRERLTYMTNRKEIYDATVDFIKGDRKNNIKGFYEYLFDDKGFARDVIGFENITGLVFSPQYKEFGIGNSSMAKNRPSIELHSLRLNNRIGPNGNVLNQIIMTLAQRCKVSVREGRNDELKFYPYTGSKADKENENFIFRGGCTLIFDLNEGKLKHAIRKPIFDTRHLGSSHTRKLKFNEPRLKMQYRCMKGDLMDEIGFAALEGAEPFAALHQAKTSFI
jgi:hypothetical protein